MKNHTRRTIQFCGFGGQGIVLSSVVFGTAAVTKTGLSAVQTQSYGSEARGGECQAELILSDSPIDSPLADRVDVLVVMSQLAINQYLPRLKSGGALIIDPEFVDPPDRTDVRLIEVPATQIASELGPTIVANMVMLGFLQKATGLMSPDDLLDVISENVPERFVDVNLKAARCGMELAEKRQVTVEV